MSTVGAEQAVGRGMGIWACALCIAAEKSKQATTKTQVEASQTQARQVIRPRPDCEVQLISGRVASAHRASGAVPVRVVIRSVDRNPVVVLIGLTKILPTKGLIR